MESDRWQIKLFCDKQHGAIFSQDAYPVTPPSLPPPLPPPPGLRLISRPPTLRPGCDVSDGLCFFRHLLSPRGVGSPCDWCYGQYEKMRAWPRPSSTEAQLKIPLFLLLERLLLHCSNHTDTQSLRLCEQMFPGGGGDSWPLTLRSNGGVHVLCTQVHMCSRVHCFAVFFFMYLDKDKGSWDRWNPFLSSTPHTSQQFLGLLLSAGAVISPLWLCGRHVSSTPLAGVLPADHELWNLVNTPVSAVIFPFPPTLFPTLPSCFPPRSSVLGFPHPQHIRVFMLQRYSPES